MGLKNVAKAILPYAVVDRYLRRYELRPTDAPLDNKKIAVLSLYDTKYTELLYDAITAAGFIPTPKLEDAKYVWLHWYENGVNDYEKFIRKTSSVNTWRKQGRKIIFHIHNKKPHDTKTPNVAHALMTLLADTSDHVSIMSTQTKDVLKNIWFYGDDFSHVSRVPHPNYIDAYGEKVEPTSLKRGTLKVLFFGLVRPYKGVEYLIEATKDLKNIEVSIIGNPSNPQYAEKIRKLCEKRKDITLRLEYISDEEIPRIFAEHHAVALPYDSESSLNSGAAILALSYGRTIIGTNNGTLNDIHNDNLYFGYDYTDEADHVKQLRRKLTDIQSKYNKDYTALLGLGDELRAFVEKENGVKNVAQAITKMIERIG